MDRRTVLGALGSMAALMVVGCGGEANGEEDTGAGALRGAIPGCDTPSAEPLPAPACVITPRQTDGPFFVDEKLRRDDLILADPNEPGVQRGVPMLLELTVLTVGPNGCAPLANAYVDIWHADANGIYSDEYKPSIQAQDTRGKKFLRAYQVTDASGKVAFKTIYPGAYSLRTIHIHFKIRTYSLEGNVTSEFTSQLYFDDLVSDRISYNVNRHVRNINDGIYRDGGSQLMLALSEDCAGSYKATYAVGIRAAS